MESSNTRTAMAVSEADVQVLCNLSGGAIKDIVRPDTTRIRKAFEAMMSGVKRRSVMRHQDPALAIEKCFKVFSGRRMKRTLGVHEFARRLSVLSMEWSGNFSAEEHLAFAQDISDQDMPGTVTFEGFRRAADVGGVYHSSSSVEDGGQVKRYSDVSDGGNHALQNTLREAASKARLGGENVWLLLDASEKQALANIQSGEYGNYQQREDAQTSLKPDTIRIFLAQLGVRILPSVPAGQTKPCSQSTTGKDHHHDHQHQPEQPLDGPAAGSERDGSSSPVKLQQEAREVPPSIGKLTKESSMSDASRVPCPVESGFLTPSCSPIPQAVEPEALKPNLREISGDTTSVSGRLQFYNSELIRTRGEALSLISRAASHPPPSPSSPLSQSASSPSLPSQSSLPDTRVGNSCEYEEPGLDVNAVGISQRSAHIETRKRKDVRGDRFPISTSGEARARTATLFGERGDRGTVTVNPTGSIVAFSRISPTEKADPSHPRVELVPRSRSTPPSPLPSTRTDQAHTDRGRGTPPGGDTRKASTASNNVRNSNGDEVKAVPSDLVSKLLVSALKVAREKNSSSPMLSPATPVERRKIGTIPKADRFDPPSIHNGLAGLTMNQVEELLLRVEASMPGAVSSWKVPESRSNGGKGGRTRGKEITASFPEDQGLTIEEQIAEVQRRLCGQARISEGLSVGLYDDRVCHKGWTPRRKVDNGEGKGAGGSGVGNRSGGGGGGGQSRRIKQMMQMDEASRPRRKRANVSARAQGLPSRSPIAWSTGRTERKYFGEEITDQDLTATKLTRPHSAKVIVARKTHQRDATPRSTNNTRRSGASNSHPQSEERMSDGGPRISGGSNSTKPTITAASTVPTQALEALGGGIYEDTLYATDDGAELCSSSAYSPHRRDSEMSDDLVGPSRCLGQDVYDDFVKSIKHKTEFSGFSPSQLVGRLDDTRSYTQAATHQNPSNTRRADWGFQRLDDDMVDSFRNCAKTKSKGSKET